jgi:hypothetical protein
MGFPNPWDPDSCRCFSTLCKHETGKDPGATPADADGIAAESVMVSSSLEGPRPSLKDPTPIEPIIGAQKKPEGAPTESRPPLLFAEPTSPPRTSTEPSPPDSDASSDENERAVGVGTDLALSIGHNLLMLTKYRGKGTYLDFCHREVRKVMQAPPGIQESILSPLHRPDRKDSYPGYGARRHPSNPHNTLRGLPTLGPEAVFKRGQICNRCEKDAGVVNIFGAGLRPVTNLGKGHGKFYWEGLPVNKHTGKAESKAFLCPGYVFPACAHNQEHQDLEYVNGQFQATKASRSPAVLPTSVPEISHAAEAGKEIKSPRGETRATIRNSFRAADDARPTAPHRCQRRLWTYHA